MIEEHFDALVRKEHDAWDACLETMREVIHPVVTLRGASLSHDVQEEIENACILDLYRQRNSFENPAKLKNLLKQMARHKVIDEIRRQPKVEFVDIAENDSLQNSPALREDSDPAQQLERLEQTQLMHEALERLDTPCQQLLVAAFFEEVKHWEIASRFGWSTESIGGRINRCRERLKKLCAEVWKTENPLLGIT